MRHVDKKIHYTLLQKRSFTSGPPRLDKYECHAALQSTINSGPRPDPFRLSSVGRLQSLSQPVCQLGPAELCKVVDALLAEVDATQLYVLRGRTADSLEDDGRVGLEDDAVVDNLVNSERDEVVVLDDCALVDGLPGGWDVRSATRCARTWRERKERTHLNSRCRESRRAMMVLYSRISFSSTPPTM
jgi:hypothetical protein